MVNVKTIQEATGQTQFYCPQTGEVCPTLTEGLRRLDSDRYTFDVDQATQNCEVKETGICSFALKAVQVAAEKGTSV